MEILNLSNTEYDGKTIRVCQLPDGRKAASIYDTISIALDIQEPRKAWSDLKKNHENDFSIIGNDIETTFFDYKFPGQGQKPTPVATARGIVRMLYLLPGKKATIFREKASEIITRFLGGDESLIQEIRANGVIGIANPDSVQAFAAADPIASEERRERLERMRAETRLLNVQGIKSELEMLNQARQYIASIQDPRLVQTINDSINNQYAKIFSSDKPMIEAAPPVVRHKTVDQILMEKATNYNSLKSETKGRIGKAIIILRGREGIEKVQKYINGEVRQCNAYPVEWEDDILMLAKREGAIIRE